MKQWPFNDLPHAEMRIHTDVAGTGTVRVAISPPALSRALRIRVAEVACIHRYQVSCYLTKDFGAFITARSLKP
jgi:hypothetical protein